MYLLAPFILQNFKKILELIQSYEDVHHFRDQNGSFAMNKSFWYKPLLLLSSTYWPISLCKILKKFFQLIQSHENVQFLDPKWLISSNENFFRKLVNEQCFFDSCPCTCQKSKSDLIY